MTLITTMNFNKQETLEQLRSGNKEVLKGLTPLQSIQLGIELQNEQTEAEKEKNPST